MSLPNAAKDTTEHPPKNAVAAPVNKQEKAADIDRKVLLFMPFLPLCSLFSFRQLRFYGVIQAFRQGRYPSNDQIDSALKYVLERSPVDQDQLSPDGRKLVQDCRDIIETARIIVQEKNSDELFQNFLWNTNSVDLSDAKKDQNEVLSVEKSKVQDDRYQGMCRFSSSSTRSPHRDAAARHLRTLGNLIATNTEVRKILSDFSVIGREILARTASHAAKSARPDQDAIAKVDRPAPSDLFEVAGSKQAGPNGTPEGQVRCASQTADSVLEGGHEGRDHPQHSEVTEIKAAPGYFLVRCHSPPMNLIGLSAILLMRTPRVTPKNPVSQVACRI